MKEYTSTCFKCSLYMYAFDGSSDGEIIWKIIRKYDDKIRQHGTHRRMCNDIFTIKIYNIIIINVLKCNLFVIRPNYSIIVIVIIVP